MDGFPRVCRWAAALLVSVASTLIGPSVSTAGEADARSTEPFRFVDLAAYQESSTPPAAASPPSPRMSPPSFGPSASLNTRPTFLPENSPTAPLGGAQGGVTTREAARLGSGGASDILGLRQGRTFEMLGDRGFSSVMVRIAQRQPPIPNPPPDVPGPNPPPGPGGIAASKGLILVPSIRSFKISEDQSPRPLDRVYFLTNYFNDVNGDVNRRFNAPVGMIQAYRNTFGVEKTFADGRGSLGAQLPINTLSVTSRNPALRGTTSSFGDLTLISKYAFWTDDESGSLISGGLALTIPTGPSRFAFSNGVTNLHYTVLTPYIGYIWGRDRFFVQGFNSVSTPTNSNDVTFLFSDIGIGYVAYRDDDVDAFLNAIVPTFEVHVNTPLNHRGLDLRDPASTTDVVNLTYGVNALFKQRARFAAAIVTPVSSPKPFDLEVIGQFTLQF